MTSSKSVNLRDLRRAGNIRFPICTKYERLQSANSSQSHPRLNFPESRHSMTGVNTQ